MSKSSCVNLNNLSVEVDTLESYTKGQMGKDGKLNDNFIKKGMCECIFRDLESNLIQHIKNADVVIGCVAWLTNINILKELKKKKYVSIVVQKEDFLRPDSKNVKLRKYYDELTPLSLCTCNQTYMNTKPNVRYMGTNKCKCHDDAVRCMGNHNSEKSPAFPRMHNKFMIFCKFREKMEKIYDDEEEIKVEKIKPYSVWTGSFNMTHNSTNSLENAVIINDKKIARKYANEWAQIYALSEPLNWYNKWCAPEHRLGT